jgi:MFS family permease
MGATPKGRGTGLRAVLGERGFRRYLGARVLGSISVQMQTVAIGAQVYGLTHRALDLGLVGLSQFLPFVLLVLPAGHVADRYDRRTVFGLCLLTQLLCALALVALTRHGLTSPWPVFAVIVVFGFARAFSMPAASALMPNLVPIELFPGAVALNSSVWQVATVAGPAIGGMLYGFAGPQVVYATVAVLLAFAVASLAGMRRPPQTPMSGAATLRAVLEGLRFVWHRKTVLGAMSLDLFAVLFGGVTALLPAFAADVLAVGPAGLGWLRAAPGLGAVVMGSWLAVWPLTRRVGTAMFTGIAVFGLMTLLFALSQSFWLSAAALAILGGADMVSVYVRHMLVQLETPDAMRGRVGAVGSLCIGASNELGEFESGLTAAWWGLVPAVLFGGAVTLLVTGLWMKLFPTLKDMDRYRHLPERG